MRYLFGDSTESDLEFNYLAFLREIVDVAVCIVEQDVARAASGDRKRACEQETTASIQAVEDLGARAAEFFASAAPAQGDPALARCAQTIANFARDTVLKERALLRAGLTDKIDQIAKDDQTLRARCIVAIEKLLRTHDLPDATRRYEIDIGSATTARLLQTTKYGVHASIELDIPSSSLFASELRVDRIVEGIEVRGLESGGGWLKKSNRVVPHKLGRHFVTHIVVDTDVTVRLRGGNESDALKFDITIRKDGEVTIQRVDETIASEFTVEEKRRTLLMTFAEKIAAAARALDDRRGALVSFELEGKTLLDHASPRLLAERFIAAVAPTVQKIAKHSRIPGELVLRRLVADDRREEIFIPIADLAKKLDGLPPAARTIFAPLGIAPATPPAPAERKAGPPAPPPRRAPAAPPPAPPASSASPASSSSPSPLPSSASPSSSSASPPPSPSSASPSPSSASSSPSPWSASPSSSSASPSPSSASSSPSSAPPASSASSPPSPSSASPPPAPHGASSPQPPSQSSVPPQGASAPPMTGSSQPQPARASHPDTMNIDYSNAELLLQEVSGSDLLPAKDPSRLPALIVDADSDGPSADNLQAASVAAAARDAERNARPTVRAGFDTAAVRAIERALDLAEEAPEDDSAQPYESVSTSEARAAIDPNVVSGSIEEAAASATTTTSAEAEPSAATGAGAVAESSAATGSSEAPAPSATSEPTQAAGSAVASDPSADELRAAERSARPTVRPGFDTGSVRAIERALDAVKATPPES